MRGSYSFSDLYAKKKYAEAHKLCDEAIAKDNGDYRAIHNKSKVYARQNNWEMAFFYVDRAIGLKKEPVFFFNKSRWLIDLELYYEAIESAEKGIFLCADSANYYYEETLYLLKAYAELNIGRLDNCYISLAQIRKQTSFWIDKKLQTKESIKDKADTLR